MLTIESTARCGVTPRILFLLEELGEPYTLVRRPDRYFVATHGRPGPIVRDGEVVFNNGLTAFRYLARTRGGGCLMPTDPVERARVDQWIDDISLDLGLLVRVLLELRAMGCAEDPALDPISSTLRALDRALSDRTFLGGLDVSAADCCLAILPRLGALLDLEPYPAIRRASEALAARPAFVRADRALRGIVRPHEVLDYWFGTPPSTEDDVLELIRRWFVEGTALDDEIRERFGPTLEAAIAGELDDWSETPEGALALVIVLDQFSRHVHRGDARAYASSDRAISVARKAIDRGDLEQHGVVAARAFLISAFSHAEDPTHQAMGVELATRVAEAAPPHWAKFVHAAVEQATKYESIIRRFGRFPHRNQIIGRTSTPEELAFLESFATTAPPQVAREIAARSRRPSPE
jgi:uncharacterized protein (DUF924 family)/glutathione S-transferase